MQPATIYVAKAAEWFHKVVLERFCLNLWITFCPQLFEHDEKLIGTNFGKPRQIVQNTLACARATLLWSNNNVAASFKNFAPTARLTGGLHIRKLGSCGHFFIS
jgi:hypothetical protein